MSKQPSPADPSPNVQEDSGASSLPESKNREVGRGNDQDITPKASSASQSNLPKEKTLPGQREQGKKVEIRAGAKLHSPHGDLHEILIKGQSTSERRSEFLSIAKHIEHKIKNPSNRPEQSHLSVSEIQGLFQSPERGVFLMHQRSRQRIFLARIGLNRMSPTPETPVVRLELDAFLDYLAEEDPELSQALRGRDLPDEVLILEQLSLRLLRKTPIKHVLWRYWTWQVVGDLIGQWRKGPGDARALRAKVGHTTFEEIRTMLARGRYLFDNEDDEEVTEHFVGWWGMLGAFSPESRKDMFPSIKSDAFDEWLEQEELGLDIETAIEANRPKVDVELSRQLSVPSPASWLRWDLAKTEVAEPEPVLPIDTEKLTRRPNWGALIFLLLVLGMITGLFYLVQNAALSHISESMLFVEQLTGIHHFALSPYSPQTLGLSMFGGYFFLLCAHIIDVGRIGTLQESLKAPLPLWNGHATEEERAAARASCERQIREWGKLFNEEGYRPTNRPAVGEITEALVIGILEWSRMVVWDILLRLFPDNGLGMNWLVHLVTKMKLKHQVFVFSRTLKRAVHERRCGNDSVAVHQILKATACYQRLQEAKTSKQDKEGTFTEDKVMVRLSEMKELLGRRITKQFEGHSPDFIAPTAGVFASLLVCLIVVRVWFPSTQSSTFYLFLSFTFYAWIALFLDVTSSIRREVHFWRGPAWRRYLLSSEIRDAREDCLAHAEELRKESEQESHGNQRHSLVFEAFFMLWSGLRWWAKVRLWGHLLTAFLFQWGKLVPLLRFAALQILRKQIFEFAYHLEWAYYEEQRGNEAEAALQMTEAIVFYRPLVTDLENDLLLKELIGRRDDMCRLIRDRFSEAHHIKDETELESLEEMVRELIDVPLSTPLGRQCSAVLKTMQRSYLDKDRDFFLTQIGSWMLSFGRTPIQIGLDNYGLVRSLHYLQSTQKKIDFLPLSESQKKSWERPLLSAHDYLEKTIRETFGLKVLEAMEEAGFEARNARESVAQCKIRDELIDLVIKRGRFGFSDVRDVISRNDMRLCDPTWKELLLGDKILRLNESFKTKFHEIYREGEAYLRLLQRFSSILFGTHIGRWICRFILIPYASSAVILVFSAYLLGHVYKFIFKIETGAEFVTIPIVLLLGVLITLIIHTETGRNIFKQILSAIGNGVRFLFMEAPRWLIQRPLIQEALKHPRALYLYRQVALPACLALLLFGLELGILAIFTRDFIDWTTMFPMFVLSCTLAYVFLNTSLGRMLLDRFVYRWLYIWQQIKDRWVIGVIRMIIDRFRALLLYLDYLIYRGDDLLRFHKGEGRHVIVVKAIGQLVWSNFTYVFRLLINLVVEPQVNPVKHFPVVTVSHKLISTMMGGVIVFLASSGITSPFVIGTVVVLFQFVTPGLCGFLVWEFKENWKLFQANQSDTLQAVRIGPHGETMESLLRRGFHSGTLPKVYEKLHHYTQSEYIHPSPGKRRRLRDQLHHVSEALEDFVERELLAAFRQRESIKARFLDMGYSHPVLGQNHIDLHFWVQVKEVKKQRYLWLLRIELEGKWLLGSLYQQEIPHDQTNRLTELEKEELDQDLNTLLQKSGIKLMRGKLEAKLSFYLRSFSVGVPGATEGAMRAEYRVDKEEVRVLLTGANTEPETIVYHLDEDARISEPARPMALKAGDHILPR